MSKQYIKFPRTLTPLIRAHNARRLAGRFKSVYLRKKALMLISCVVLAACTSTISNEEKSSTEIIVIGTTHSETAEYSSTVLEQILSQIKPDVILYEVDSSFFDSEGRLMTQYREGQEGKAVWKHHVTTGVPIEPYEMEGRNQYYKKTNYFAHEAAFFGKLLTLYKDGQLTPKATAQVAAVLASFELRDTCSNAKPDYVNSPVCDAIVRKKHFYMYDVLLNVAEENEALHEFTGFLREAARFWKTRNDAMAANIIAKAKIRRGQRIVVITGFEHRPELLERLHTHENDIGYSISHFNQ